MINFDIIGKIKGKARPRFYKNMAITPKATVDYENLVKFYFYMAKQQKIDGDIPLIADIICHHAIPKSYSTVKRQQCIQGQLMPTKKPDIDNIAKIILDSLNGLAYDDDKQVIMLQVRKLYTDQEEKIKVKIEKYRSQGGD